MKMDDCRAITSDFCPVIPLKAGIRKVADANE